MKLKYITFLLENCDVITIDGKYIGNFLIDNIRTTISRIACNSIMKMDIADTIVIEIHKNANKKRHHFNFDSDYNEHTVFDRLQEWNDITSIKFKFEEQYVEENKTPRQEEYTYYVYWEGNSDEENEAQSTYISNDGNLYIVISKDKTVEDFFDLELINDSEHMELCWRMYGIKEV